MFHWVDWDFLIAEGETPQGSLPFWQPPRGRYLNYGRMDNSRAIDRGMTFRPLAVTAKDTLDWHRKRAVDAQDKLRVGMTREREAELLEKWVSVGSP
jgi:2'-hydroxyisoflavone reductase